ncbi:MAG TPA: substrate-binding domain-containing protein [Bryobacteraceae bacterium]|nr:substrate-binding domain-containing protein [Bryobacteraceae bacterium]
MRLVRRTLALAIPALLLLHAAAFAQEIKVMTSGAFTAAYRELVPQFEKKTHYKVTTAYGPSMGGEPNSIPMRLDRGEPVDVVILARPGLDDLVKKSKVIPASCVDLVRSETGMAVKAGAPKPDISTLDAFKKALLNAKSIAYSDSASGIYISTELFQKLGIADQVLPKSKRTTGQVGLAVARGDAEIGFQQISELRAVKGIDVVGPLPAGAQKVVLFSAGIATDSHNPDAAQRLIDFFLLPESAPVIKKSGLKPIHDRL